MRVPSFGSPFLPRPILPWSLQLEAGDVVALHGATSPSISFWPARSAQAQAFRQFEQSSIHRALKGGLQAAPRVAGNNASTGACGSPGSDEGSQERHGCVSTPHKRKRDKWPAAQLQQPDRNEQQPGTLGEEAGSWSQLGGEPAFGAERGPAEVENSVEEQGGQPAQRSPFRSRWIGWQGGGASLTLSPAVAHRGRMFSMPGEPGEADSDQLQPV